MGSFLVMKNNFKRSFNKKLSMVMTLLLPIIICLLAGFIRLGEADIRIGILESGLTEFKAENKKALFSIIENSKGMHIVFSEQESTNTDLITGRFNAILDYRNSSSIENFKLITLQNNEKKLESMIRNILENKTSLDSESPSSQGISIKERTIALLLTMFMIISSIHASVIIKDKQNGTFLRYKFAQKSGISYIMGYIAYNFAITYTQVIVCITILGFIQNDFNISISQLFFLGALIALTSTVISTLVSLSSKSEMHANITTSSIAAVSSILGGSFVAVEAMPGLLRTLSILSPVRWILELI